MLIKFDINKAFDSVQHKQFFKLAVANQVPCNILAAILREWSDMWSTFSVSRVTSAPVQLMHGVRQGGAPRGLRAEDPFTRRAQRPLTTSHETKPEAIGARQSTSQRRR